ncbi:hypothetical protein ACIBG5_23125 [Kribbella sp. NPDC050241]|uniref:hypothetical protein n=1 Tax=Kribbella sp. NPDC050241 TaxID=3364115 RepID=UPI0037B6DEF9
MMPSATTRLAWSMFATTAALGVAHGVLVLSGSSGLIHADAGLNAFPMITIGCVLGAFVGALIATRLPRNPIGWLFLVGQLGTGIGLVCQAYAFRVLEDGELGSQFTGQVATVLSSALGASWALSVLAAVFLLFPDGSLPSKAWRAVLWALPVPQVVAILSTVLLVPIDTITSSVELNPLVTAIGAVAAIVNVALLLLAVVALVLRLRRARGEQRQQLRWLTTAAFALVAGFVLAQVISLGPDDAQVWSVVPLFVAYASVPVAAGLAILKYRLYDIDLVINRAVVAAVALIFVTAAYVSAVALLGAVIGGQVSEQYLVSVIATALVALVFQPLRSGMQRVGNRVAYGRRAAPYQALADLCRHLSRAVSLDQIMPGVAEVAGRSVGAEHTAVRLAVAGTDDIVAQWPGPAGLSRIAYSEPVWHNARQLGEISVSMPAGRQLSRADRTLLTDLATQAGLGLRNAQLAAQLQARVDQTGVQAEELDASWRRLLAAQESQRQRLTRAVTVEVLPHLERIRSQLARAETDPASVGSSLDEATNATSRALAALRDVARGVYPATLTRRGLAAALSLYAAHAGGRVLVSISPTAERARFDSHIEAAAYFCAVETLRGLGGSALLELRLERRELTLTITATDGRASQWDQPEVDRVLACGGTAVVDSSGSAVILRASIPVVGREQPT